MEDDNKVHYTSTFAELFLAYNRYIQNNADPLAEALVFENNHISSINIDIDKGIMAISFIDSNIEDREIPLRSFFV